MSYTPPPGAIHGIPLTFGASYTPPAGNAVDLVFADAAQNIHARGWLDDVVQTPFTVSWRQYIVPSGLNQGGIGAAGVRWNTIWNWDFSVSYTPPAADAVDHVFGAISGTLYPSSIGPEEFGAHTVAWGAQSIVVTGTLQTSYGTPTVYNSQQLAYPSGILGTTYGTPTVLGTPEIKPAGIAAGSVGSHTIWHQRRWVSPSGITGAVGSHSVTLYDRYLDLSGKSIPAGSIGTHSVQLKTRYVLPPYINAPAMGNVLVGYHQTIAGIGFDAALYGTAWVHDLTQWVNCSGYVNTQWGDTWVSHSPRPLYPQGFPSTSEITPSTRWGRPTVENRNQYVRQIFNPGQDDGGVFGSYLFTFVENRNRIVGHIGHLDSKFSKFTNVENNADPVYPPGLETIGWGTTRVEHYVRYISTEGWEEFYSHPLLTAVHNAARTLAPAGMPPGQFGLAAHSNIEQNIRFVGRIFEADYGTPFVAFAVRDVAPPSMLPGMLGEPTLQLGIRYVSPQGIEKQLPFGDPFVYEHFTIFRPSGWNALRLSEDHLVANRNRPVYPFPWEALEMDRPTLHLMTRYVQLEGYDQTRWGQGYVQDRRQTSRPNAILPPLITGPVVTKWPPDPPAAQTIYHAGFTWTTYGVGTVRPNEIYPDGTVMTKWGQHEVRLIGAIVSSILAPDPQFGTPLMRGPQSVEPVGIKSLEEASRFPKHALSPHTIWCTPDVTAQAVANNGGQWKQVDHELDLLDTGMRPFFGTPTVSNYYRGITQTGTNDYLKWGDHAVTNQHRRVYVDGLRSQRFGIPRLPGLQYIDFRRDVAPVGAMGTPTVELQDRALLVESVPMPGEGTEDGQYGAHEVDFFHRYRYPTGWDSSLWGVPSPQNNRNSVGIRVHYPDPFIPTGTLMTQWGPDTWISYKIRNVYPEGFLDSDGLASSPGYFRDRMRVTKRSPYRGVAPTGFQAGTIGGHTIGQGTRTLYVDRIPGNGPLGYPTARAQNIVALAGFGIDAQEFGDVQRWEAGKIKTQGQDFSDFGNLRTHRVAYPLGLMDELIGSPAVGPSAAVAGFLASDYGLAALSYVDGLDFVCGQRPRAIALMGFDASTVGAHTVA